MVFSLGDLAVKFGCDVVGNPETEISSVATLSSAKEGSLTFYSNALYKEKLKKTNASVVVLKGSDIDLCPVDALLCEDPYQIYTKIVALLHPLPCYDGKVSGHALIKNGANVAESSYIGEFTSIGRDVTIGENVFIGPGCIIEGNVNVAANSRIIANVTIINSVDIGERVIIHPGAVIGADGFGNVKTENGWLKINQIGGVKIGNDVEIGSNTTIDRGSLEDTVIHNGVRLDNLIQIGHNVSIGEHTAIAASAAIAGSSEIGKRCMIAGQVGIVGHINICDDVRINGAAVITKDIKKPGVYSGSFPFEEDKVWKKLVAKFRRSNK